MTISAVILINNSSGETIRAIRSVSFCDEIILIYDKSGNKNVAINLDLNIPEIKVFQKSLQGDFSSQRNFGLSKASGDWILFLDSDEEITKNLKNEILETVKNKDYVGIYLKRLDIFMGKKLKYGETGNIKLLRLARKNCGKWQGRVHEIWQVRGKIGNLDNCIIHHHDLNISQFLQRIDVYSSLAAKEIFESYIKEHFAYHILKPAGKFVHNYILRLGFLDGYAGLTMAWLMSWHSLLVRIKLRLMYLDIK